MEEWDAYNRNGEKLEGTLIRGKSIPKGIYHIVCEVFVEHKDGTYLCTKRAKTKEKFPEYYETTAGGSALKGEDKYSCIKRELMEETGIVCNDFTQVKRTIVDKESFIMYSFVCTVDCDKNSVKLQPGETEDYKWLTKEEFVELINSDRIIKDQKERFYNYFLGKNIIG